MTIDNDCDLVEALPRDELARLAVEEREGLPQEERALLEATQHYIKGRFGVEKVDCEASHIKGPINAKSPPEAPKTMFPFMSRDDALNSLEEIFSDELGTWVVANSEYADSENVFANFNRISDHLGIPPEQVLMVYAHKHMDGITSWVKGNKQHREPIIGRINDLRIYLAILALMDIAREVNQETDSPQGMKKFNG